MSWSTDVDVASVSLVIFGFDARTTRSDVEAVLRGCGVPLRDAGSALDVAIRAVPGDSNQVYAQVLHLPGRWLANRLADGVNARRHHGRRLQSWVPVMDWS